MSTPRCGHCRLVWLLDAGISRPWRTPVQAQYFGRNKVQYESFDFRVLKTEHFDIYFYPPEEAAAATPHGWRSGGTPGCPASSTTSCPAASR